MIYWLVETLSEHPAVAVISALGSLLAGIAAVIDARAARHSVEALRYKVTDLDKRVAILESKK